MGYSSLACLCGKSLILWFMWHGWLSQSNLTWLCNLIRLTLLKCSRWVFWLTSLRILTCWGSLVCLRRSRLLWCRRSMWAISSLCPTCLHIPHFLRVPPCLSWVSSFFNSHDFSLCFFFGLPGKTLLVGGKTSQAKVISHRWRPLTGYINDKYVSS